MSSRNSDVQLVIRAKDQAQRTIDGVADALKSLLAGQDGVESSGAQLAGQLVKLDRAYASIVGSAKDAGAAIDRQQRNFVEANLQLSALRQQADLADRALGRLGKMADKAFVGPPTREFVERYQAVRQEADLLGKQITRLTRDIAAQQGGITTSESSLLRLVAAESALAAASDAARTRIDAETAAIKRQADEAERNARVLQTVERSTGVQRSGREDYDGLVAQLRQQETEAARVTAEYEQQGREARRIADAQREINALLDRRGGKSARESASVFRDNRLTQFEKEQADATEAAAAAQAAALRDAGIAYQMFEARVRQGAAEMRGAEQAAQEEAAAIRRLKEEIDPLAAVEARLARETEKLVKWQREGKISAGELDGALRLLSTDAERAKAALSGTGAPGSRSGLFGLRPYELQNLGYQVNDVVTQLASGTSLAQTLGQQGGQILQIFPKIGSAILAAFGNPVVLAFAGALGTAGTALHEIGEQDEQLRSLDGVLRANADGAAYQAKNLSSASLALERYGVSAEDALKLTRTFLAEGLDLDRFEQFGRTAKDLADVLGIDVTDAAGQVAEGFSGGYDAIKKLDDATHFLSAAEREHVKTLFEEGRAAEARNGAFEIFAATQEDAASRMRGPWADAARALGNGYDVLLKGVANTNPIRELKDAFDDLAGSITSVVNKLAGFRNVSDVAGDISRTEKEIARLEESSRTLGDVFGIKASQIADLRQQLADYRKELAATQKQEAKPATTGDTRRGNSERTKKADAELADSTARAEAENKTLDHRTRLQNAYNDGLREAQRLQPDSSAEAQAAFARAARDKERLKIEKEVTAEREKQERRGSR